MDLTKLRVLLAGRFTDRERKELLKALEQVDAHVRSGLARSTGVVICGEKPGAVGLERARALGIPILTLREATMALDREGTSSSRLTELRASLDAKGGRSRWDAVCAVLDTWPEDQDLEVALDYARTHLAGGEDAERKTPIAWLDRAAAGERERRLWLCRNLHLYYPDRSATWLQSVLDAPDVSRVQEPWTHIAVTGLAFEDELVERLPDTSIWPGLRSLFLHQCHVTSNHLRTLTRGASAALQHLVLSQNALGASDLDALAHLKALETLDLSENTLGDVGVETLSNLTLPHLKVLGLGGIELGDAGSRHLAQLDLPGLRTLSLGRNPLSDASLARLLPDMLPLGIERLSVRNSNFADAAMTALAVSPALATVKSLDLSRSRIGPEGAAALAASPHTNALRYLDLYGNTIGPEGAVAIARSEHFADLGGLHLWNCKIGAKGKRALIKAGYTPTQTGGRWVHPARVAYS